MDLFEKLIEAIGALGEVDRMAKLAANAKPRLTVDTSELSFDRVFLAIQFLRKLHRLSDESAKQIGRTLEADG